MYTYLRVRCYGGAINEALMKIRIYVVWKHSELEDVVQGKLQSWPEDHLPDAASY